MVFHGEVNFGGLPFVATFVEQGSDQSQEGVFIGEEASDAGAAFEFPVDPLQSVTGTQSELVGEWQGKDGEALGQIGFYPGGEFGRANGVEGHDFFEASFSGRTIRAVEHAADSFGDGGPLVQAGDIGLGILLEGELAALPPHGREDRGAGGARASGRERHAWSWTSSLAAHWLTWVELTEVPQSCSTMAETLRVETPWTYISARASMSACSLRTPFSKALG